MIRPSRLCCLFAAALLCAAPAQAQQRTQASAAAHEQQLASIRQALLEATLERPTRIVSSAWIDADGALHEDSSFHSAAEVRGVRVLPYVDDDSGRVSVLAEVLPPGLGSAQEAGCTPEPTQRAWRLPVQLETRLASGFVGSQAFASASLLELAGQSWLEQGAHSTRWYFLAAEPAAQPAYLRALTGSFEHAPAPDWRLVLELSPSAEEADSLFDPPDWARTTPRPWRWTLSLSLLQRQSEASTTRLQMQQVLEVTAGDATQGPHIWQRKYLLQIRELLQQWQARLDGLERCAPVRFPLRLATADTFQLEAGQASGLRVGDRMLIMNRTRVPSQMLQAGLSLHLALAEVSQVGARRTLLKQLAGPPLSAPGEWVALPL